MHLPFLTLCYYSNSYPSSHILGTTLLFLFLMFSQLHFLDLEGHSMNKCPSVLGPSCFWWGAEGGHNQRISDQLPKVYLFIYFWRLTVDYLIYFNWRIITLYIAMVFVIHRHESATGAHASPHPEPPPPIPLGWSTGFECPASCIKLALVIYFTYSNTHVSVLFSQIVPPLPSPTGSKSLFFMSVSLLLLCI